MKKITLLLSFIALLASTQIFAQTTWTMFSEDFEDQIATTRWDIVEAGDANKVNLAASYAALGADVAPEGGEYCAKIEVNTDTLNGEFSFVGLFPKEFSIKPPYKLTFNAWLNWAGDSGTTEFAFYGLGHATQEALPTDGFDFAFTGDNGSSRDLRLYGAGAELKPDECSTCLYADADAGQNNIEGSIYAGSVTGDNPGGQWLTLSIEATEDAVIFYVNDVEWARVAEAASEGNVVVGYMDIFSSVAPETNYMLIDNIKVTKVSPENTTEKSFTKTSIYPNPATGTLNVDVKENSTFTLFNLTGQTLVSQSITSGKNHIDISKLTSGMYISKITNESGKSEIIKVQVQ